MKAVVWTNYDLTEGFNLKHVSAGSELYKRLINNTELAGNFEVRQLNCSFPKDKSYSLEISQACSDKAKIKFLFLPSK